jgi:hypothetical protein
MWFIQRDGQKQLPHYELIYELLTRNWRNGEQSECISVLLKVSVWVWWGCHFSVFFPPLLLEWTRLSGSPVARSTGALPPVTLRLLRFIAQVHRNHVSPFSSIHISTRRNSAFFIGYKHAHRPSHVKRNTKFYFCELGVWSLRSTCSYMLRLAPHAMILQPHVTILRLYSPVHPTTARLNTHRNMWS